MNHNLVPNIITGITYENFLVFHMQSFLKCYQAQINTQIKLLPPPETETSRCGARTLAWNSQEDSILENAVKAKGPKHWSKVAKQINYQVYNGNQLRKGKHCRERWFNHLNPELNSKYYLETGWSVEEDSMLWQLQKENGNSWSLISKALPGRTENTVRNRWNILSKQKKKLNFKE